MDNIKLIKRITIIVMITSIMLAASSLKTKTNKNVYITNNMGELVGIRLTEGDNHHDISLNAQNDEGEIVVADISINNNPEGENVKEDEGKTFDEKIQDIIFDIENKRDNKIDLPDKTEEGDDITWSIHEKQNYDGFLYLLISIGLIMIVIKNDKYEAIKKNNQYKKSVLMELPRFSNQLLLLLNSGLILNDCINRIIDNYKSENTNERNVFKNELIEIQRQATAENVNILLKLNDYSNNVKIKELSRLTAVIVENSQRGNDIRDKIETENKYLWETRKVIARENGRYIETRMILPLSLLLMVLILVTMAPAIMNM